MEKQLVDRLIREVLRHPTERSSLYMLVDAARADEAYEALLEPGLDVRCLYSGELPAVLARAAPYLVEVDPESVLADTIRERWGQSWGVLLRASVDIEALRRHFKKLNVVRGPDGKQLLFRYYDPRVLRVYLPTCTPAELKRVFGPVEELITEGAGASTIRFAFDGERLSVTHAQVADAGSPG